MAADISTLRAQKAEVPPAARRSIQVETSEMTMQGCEALPDPSTRQPAHISHRPLLQTQPSNGRLVQQSFHPEQQLKAFVQPWSNPIEGVSQRPDRYCHHARRPSSQMLGAHDIPC